MRVIAGIAKGRILKGPKGLQIRPALDKVKQAIFNILGDVREKRVLDLFAGTGSIGIEALSRGAAHATFVDSSPEAIQLIEKNLEKCGFITHPRPLSYTKRGESKTSVVKLQIPEELKRVARPEGAPRRRAGPLAGRAAPGDTGATGPASTQFDLIFIDPPYDKNLVNPTLRAIARQNLLAPGGTVVVEHSPREAIAGDCGLTLADQRKYGQTLTSFLEPTS